MFLYELSEVASHKEGWYTAELEVLDVFYEVLLEAGGCLGSGNL